MSELAQIDWANLPLFAILVLGLLGLGYFQWKMYQTSQQMQRDALTAGTESVKASISAFQQSLKETRESYTETQKETRAFYAQQAEDLRKRIHELEERIRSLESEGSDKDKRIADLEEENKSLHEQVDQLRVRLDAKNGVSKRKTAKTEVSE